MRTRRWSWRWSWRWWYIHIAINRLARRFAPNGYTGEAHSSMNHWLWNLNTWAHENNMDRMPTSQPKPRHSWHRDHPTANPQDTQEEAK